MIFELPLGWKINSQFSMVLQMTEMPSPYGLLNILLIIFGTTVESINMAQFMENEYSNERFEWPLIVMRVFESENYY